MYNPEEESLMRLGYDNANGDLVKGSMYDGPCDVTEEVARLPAVNIATFASTAPTDTSEPNEVCEERKVGACMRKLTMRDRALRLR